MKITACKLTKDIHIPQTRMAAILKGERRLTAGTAPAPGYLFRHISQIWLGLQDDYDVEEERNANEKELLSGKKHTARAA